MMPNESSAISAYKSLRFNDKRTRFLVVFHVRDVRVCRCIGNVIWHWLRKSYDAFENTTFIEKPKSRSVISIRMRDGLCVLNAAARDRICTPKRAIRLALCRCSGEHTV